MPFTVTATEVLLKLVDWKAAEAIAMLEGPRLDPNTVKIEPCAMPEFGNPGWMLLAALVRLVMVGAWLA